MPEIQSPIKPTRKRSELSKDIAAVGKIIRALKPLDQAARERVIAAAQLMMQQGT